MREGGREGEGGRKRGGREGKEMRKCSIMTLTHNTKVVPNVPGVYKPLTL